MDTSSVPHRKKKCHGNRKLRRWRKQYSKRGINEEEIRKLITDRNQTINVTTLPIVNNNNPVTPTEDMETTTTAAVTTTEITTTHKRKRKRMPISSSTLSLSKQQPARKKTKRNILVPMKTNHRLPAYLRSSSKILFSTLRRQLQHRLSKNTEQNFIYNRLQLLDRQHCLNLHRNIWQSYLTIGSEQQLWPIQVYKMAKTNEHELCQQFVMNHLSKIQSQFNQCTTKLMTQSDLCPSTLLPLNRIDENLIEYVQLQEKHLSTKMNSQLNRFKNQIHERELLKNLSLDRLTIDQRNAIEQIIQLQDKQLEFFNQFVQLETQILYQVLPENFNNLEDCIVPDDLNLVFMEDKMALTFQHQRDKIIRETKRTWLYLYVELYEITIENYEHQYQFILNEMKTNKLNNIDFMEAISAYLDHRKNRIKQEIYFEKLPRYRTHLLRMSRHQLQLASTNNNKKLINVSPQIIFDLLYHPFNTAELTYLSRGKNYIRPNQSALHRYSQRIKQIQKEHTEIMNKLKYFFDKQDDNDRTNRIQRQLTAASFYKFYSERLLAYLTVRYMAPLPFIDQTRSRQELNLVKSIRRKLKKAKLILCQTDKSGVFYIGRIVDYEQKAWEHLTKMGAYEELSSSPNPLHEQTNKVIQLLTNFRSKGKISE